MINESFGNATPTDITALENRIGFSLPDDYKQFLHENNGGSFTGSVFIEDLKEHIPVHVLFGLDIDTRLNLLSWYEEYSDDLLSGTIIIGIDPGGGFFILSTEPDVYGVYYWDHAHVFNESSDDLNTYFIANTFSDFIKELL